MSDLIYDDETSSSFATVVNDDEQHRVRLTANVAGDITFDVDTAVEPSQVDLSGNIGE